MEAIGSLAEREENGRNRASDGL